MKKNIIWMLAAILLLCGTMALISCSDSNDNKDDTTPEPTPAVELADYTLFIYGHAGGDMDEIIENVYAGVRPLLADQKKVRVLFFYKYGHHTKDAPFTGKFGNEDEVVRFELTADTQLDKLRTEACFEENSQFQLYS